MSDFFASLAGRIDGTLPVLKPRLPSLFESGGEQLSRDDTPALAVESTEREAVPLAPIHRETPKAATAPARPVATEESPIEPPPRTSSKRNVVREDGAPAVEFQPAPYRIRRAATRRDEQSDAPPSVVPPRTAVEPAPPTVRAAPAAMDVPLAHLERVVIERHREIAADPRPMPSQRAAAVPSKPLMPLHYATPATPPFALPSPLLPQSARPAATREQARPASPRETAEPTIHVSIGRIEIRAETEARPRRKQAEASPVMSLDDYLRSRAK